MRSTSQTREPTRTASCPPDRRFADLVEGVLDDVSAELLVAHVEECSSCALRLERAERDDLSVLRDRVGLASCARTTIPDSPDASGGPFAIPGYELIEEIGRGGQGIVCLARQESSGREVAIKLLCGGGHSSVRQLRRFDREIEIGQRLCHPGIVEILDVGVRDGDPYYVMEYIDGVPLTHYVEQRGCGRTARLRLLGRVCDVVAHAHAHGVVHRDLKPGNILVDAAGQTYLLDFGLLKALGATGAQWTPLTAGGEFLGTLAYAAPEQSLGDPSLITPATDVFSLGVLMYRLLTGGLPRPMPNTAMLTDRLPLPPGVLIDPLAPPLAAVLHRALEERPADRFPDANSMSAALTKAIDEATDRRLI